MSWGIENVEIAATEYATNPRISGAAESITAVCSKSSLDLSLFNHSLSRPVLAVDWLR